jgi:phenylalanyl-tRNA synthetase alpha chain
MHDTFYLQDAGRQHAAKMCLLRTHTSPVQIRYMQRIMERYKHLETMPEIRMICRRVASIASTPTPRIHRCSIRSKASGLARSVSFADLKGVVADFLRSFFESDDLQGALPSVILSVH